MEFLQTADAPAPGGHYSQAVIHGDLVFVSGQLPFAHPGKEMVGGGIEAQADRVIDHVAAILAEAGSSLAHVLKATIFITDMEHWAAVNAVFARRFGNHRPARAIVPCGPLHHGALLEMEVIASCSNHQPITD